MAIPPDVPMDTLRDMVNAGMDRAAASLNVMLDSPVELEIPSVALFRQEELAGNPKFFGDSPISCVRMGFSGPVAGTALLVFSRPSAVRLVGALIGQDAATEEMNALMTEALKEVGNIIINCIIGTIGNILGHTLDLSLPDYLEGRLEELLKPATHPDSLTVLLLVRTRFRAQKRQIDGNIFLIFEIDAADTVRTALDPLPV